MNNDKIKLLLLAVLGFCVVAVIAQYFWGIFVAVFAAIGFTYVLCEAKRIFVDQDKPKS